MGLFGRKNKMQNKIDGLHGMLIKYVTERRDDNDDVIGRGGSLSVRKGELLVFSSGDIIIRFAVDGLVVSELLSGDGVVLTGKDNLTGESRSVIAHFVYYRK